MKHIKTFENQIPFDFSKSNIDISNLASEIDDILGEYLEIEDVPYALEDGLKQINYDSRKKAAIAIVEYLKTKNII